jgi:hypothetical protein
MVPFIDDLMDVANYALNWSFVSAWIALDEVVQNAVDANRPIIDHTRGLVVNLPGVRFCCMRTPAG